jgi:hypothetical protein
MGADGVHDPLVAAHEEGDRPVAEAVHEHPGHGRQDDAMIERGREGGSGLREDPEPSLRLGLLGAGGLLGLVQARVLDGHRRALREVLGEGEVLLRVRAARLRPDERDRSEGASADPERYDDGRSELEVADERLQLRARADRILEQLGRDLGDELGPARAHDVGHAVEGAGIGRIAPTEFPGELHLRRIDVGDGHGVDRALGADEVDRAPVREPRHHEVGHALQRLVHDQRGGEHSARLREERQALAGDLQACEVRALAFDRRLFREALLVDIGHAPDPLHDPSVVVAAGRGACDEPSIGLRRRVPEAPSDSNTSPEARAANHRDRTLPWSSGWIALIQPSPR